MITIWSNYWRLKYTIRNTHNSFFVNRSTFECDSRWWIWVVVWPILFPTSLFSLIFEVMFVSCDRFDMRVTVGRFSTTCAPPYITLPLTRDTVAARLAHKNMVSGGGFMLCDITATHTTGHWPRGQRRYQDVICLKLYERWPMEDVPARDNDLYISHKVNKPTGYKRIHVDRPPT